MSATRHATGLERQELLAALEAAAAHFQANLHSPRGATARAYLAVRGITRGTIERIRAGLAVDSWDDILGALRPRFGEQVLVNAGLVIHKPERRRRYDRFRNRVVFPICDERGQVLAYGGRTLDAREPKYINSPDSMVYQKRRTLYGLQWAARAALARGRVILVEGFLDALAILQCGIEEVVASCGTAFTAAQAHLLARLAKRVLICFDGDEAGRRSTTACLHLLLAHRVNARVTDLPPGRDPASLVSEGGDKLLSTLQQQVPGLEWLIRIAALEHDLASPSGKGTFMAVVIQALMRLQRELRPGWLRLAAEVGGIDPAAAIEELNQAEASLRFAGPTRRTQSPSWSRCPSAMWWRSS